MAWQIQYRGEWAGHSSQGRWLPAVTGTLNQTGKSDHYASNFMTEGEAAFFAEEHLPSPEDAYGVEFRIEEVSS